jgi:hypothetical protein
VESVVIGLHKSYLNFGICTHSTPGMNTDLWQSVTLGNPIHTSHSCMATVTFYRLCTALSALSTEAHIMCIMAWLLSSTTMGSTIAQTWLCPMLARWLPCIHMCRERYYSVPMSEALKASAGR